MSDVASLKNCKRLYELSGWEDTEYTYYANAGKHSGAIFHRSMVFDKDENMPAYDAGYLLRKLPGYAVLKHVDEEHSTDGDTFWKTVYQSHIKGTWIEAKGCDTPEDALCLLAIKLFEEGILNNEAN